MLETFERVQRLGLQPARFARQRLGDARRHERLGEDRRHTISLGEVAELGDPIRRRLLVRGDAGDGMLLEAVAPREPAEGLVRRHDLVACAMREPLRVLLVERGQLFGVRLRIRASTTPRGSGSTRPSDSATVATISCISFGSSQTCGSSAFDPPSSTDLSPASIDRSSRTNTVWSSARRLRDVLDRGLEVVAHRHDEIGILECVDLPRRELQVVGFGAGRREVGDAHGVAADLSHRFRERVEGRDDGNLAAAVGGAVVVAATRPEHERPARDEHQRPRNEVRPTTHNENDSYSAPSRMQVGIGETATDAE